MLCQCGTAHRTRVPCMCLQASGISASSPAGVGGFADMTDAWHRYLLKLPLCTLHNASERIILQRAAHYRVQACHVARCRRRSVAVAIFVDDVLCLSQEACLRFVNFSFFAAVGLPCRASRLESACQSLCMFSLVLQATYFLCICHNSHRQCP